MNVDTEIDGLFRLPLGEFITARNALVARLHASGVADAATRVKALAKPSVSVWAANQVYWTERASYDAMIEAGGRLRAAQQKSAGPDVIRDAMRQRREALAAVVKHAETILAAAGHAPTPATMLRVGKTFEALAAQEGAGPTPGRLTADLDPPGFEALAGLTFALAPAEAPPAGQPVPPATEDTVPARAQAPPPPQPVVPATENTVVEPARAAVARAEEELRARRSEAEEASTRHDMAVRQVRAAEQMQEDARSALARAEKALNEARDAAEEARLRSQAAARAHAEAEAALEGVRRALQVAEHRGR